MEDVPCPPLPQWRDRGRPANARITRYWPSLTDVGYRLRSLIRRGGAALIGIAAIAAVILFLNPSRVGSALTHFRLVLIVPILVLSVGVFLLQGLRWHFLLRDVGTRLRLRDTLLVNIAGQTITALVPLGDLTRAAFASAATGTDFGTAAATVTVQELSYTLVLILAALPAILALGYGLAAVVPVAIGIAAIVIVLTVSPIFCRAHDLVAHIPFLNRLLPAIRELQAQTVVILHRRDALALTVLDAARVVVAVTAFWLVVEGLEPGHIGWWQAAFVLTLATLGGAVSLLPGGVGANEATVAALLIFLGVDYGVAGAAAIIQRGLLTGLSLLLGASAYAAIHRRLHLGGIFQLVTRRPAASAA
jgi:uncharacterized membrane protein YbhN (UPF0104 family)